MTRFLKLVRHEDGKWKALSTESDDLSGDILTEKCAPINPQQLLNALDNLLSSSGGIKSAQDVPRLASLMKKFSKKLVSRCVYNNVLLATETDILSEYLDKGGWETINLWLQYAKSSSSHSFLMEMLQLCKLLPMTLKRLKENNTAKLVKSMTKHEHDDVKILSNELVTKWMSIIKEKKAADIKEKKTVDAVPVEKKKKDKSKNEIGNSDSKVHTKAESPKGPEKVKGKKRPSCEKETKKDDLYEDVKIDAETILPPPKKAKPDRPKTAKIFQKKFRATGLEEETPLPKNISKKSSTVDKSTVAAAKNALKTNQPTPILPERVTEKKIKPENLMTINDTPSLNKGIKLIPAKPKPTYVLHESASFMDALISQPVVPVKRKKKAQPNKQASSPTSPTLVPPKLQFYKDTLETSEDKKEENEKDNISNEENANNEDSGTAKDADEPMDVAITEEGGRTPPNDDASNNSVQSEATKDSVENSQDVVVDPFDPAHVLPFDPNHIRSILSHGRRRGNKKSVKWVEDDNIKEIFYFELDETERVNVLKTQNFGDMKSIELKREREALEQAKRQAGDKMEEMIRWWTYPIKIEAPAPLIEPGYQSKERENEKLRQQATLQEIYFTKEMIPDSPHEPDLEIVPPQDARIIPVDEDNTVGALMDYSHMDVPNVLIPDVLSNLIKLNSNRTLLPLPTNSNEPVLNDPNFLTQSLLNSVNPINTPMTLAQPYDPAEPVNVMPPNNLLGPPPALQNMYNGISPDAQNVNSQEKWQQQFYGGYQVNSNPIVDTIRNINQIPNMNLGLELNQGPNINRSPELNQVPNMNRGPEPNHGHNMNRGPEMNQGHNINRGPEMNRAHNMNRGSDMNHGHGMNRGPEMNRGPGMNQGPRPRIMQDSYRPSHKGSSRGMGPRPPNAHRIPCRHFIANGCRFGMKCTFLHPGVNGPPL